MTGIHSAAGQVENTSDFDFDVSPSTPAGHELLFELEVQTDQGTWILPLSFTVGTKSTGRLELSTNEIDIGSGSGDFSIFVRNEEEGVLNWMASTKADWLAIENSSGSIQGIDSERFSADFVANPETSARVTTVIFTAPGATDSPQTLTVMQEGRTPPEPQLVEVVSFHLTDDGTGNAAITFIKVAGRNYRIEGSPDLGTWTTLIADVPGEGEVQIEIPSTNPTPSRPKYFIRIVEQ